MHSLRLSDRKHKIEIGCEKSPARARLTNFHTAVMRHGRKIVLENFFNCRIIRYFAPQNREFTN